MATEKSIANQTRVGIPSCRIFPVQLDEAQRADIRRQAEAKDADTLTIDVAIASDAQLYRYGVYERLDMSGVNLDWANSADARAPMQGYSHDAVERFGERGHVGNFDNARVMDGPGGTRQVVVRAIFYRGDEPGMAMAEQIAMGKMKNVSVEYKLRRPDGARVEEVFTPAGERVPLVTLTDWEVTGFAWVTKPADRNYTGLGRAEDDGATIFITTPNKGDNAMTTPVKEKEVKPAEGARTDKPEAAPVVEKPAAVKPADEGVRTDAPAPAAPAADEATRADNAPAEVQIPKVARIGEIVDFARNQAGLTAEQLGEITTRGISEGWRVEQYSQAVIDAASNQPVPSTKGERKAVNILNNKDSAGQAGALLMRERADSDGRIRITRDLLTGDPHFMRLAKKSIEGARANEAGILANFEGLADDAVTDDIIASLFQNSKFLSRIPVYPRVLGRDEVIPVQSGDYSDFMRAKRGNLQAGQANTNVATVDEKRVLEMKIHGILARIDKDILRQVSAYNQLLMEQLGQRLPALLEKRIIQDNGTGGVIKGLISLAADTSFAEDIPAGTAYHASTNAGAPMTLQRINKLLEAKSRHNFDSLGNPVFITSTELAYRGTEILDFSVSSTGVPLFREMENGAMRFRMKEVISSNFVPQMDGNKGIAASQVDTPTAATRFPLLCAHLNDFFIGYFGDMEIVVDRVTRKQFGQVEYLFETGVDFQPRHDHAVVATLDFTNAAS